MANFTEQKSRTRMSPAVEAAVNAAINQFAAKNFLNGGAGSFGYLWVTGAAVTPKGNPSKRRVKKCFCTGSVRVTDLVEKVRSINGVDSLYFNYD